MNTIVKAGLLVSGAVSMAVAAGAQTGTQQANNSIKTTVMMEKKFQTVNGLKMAYVETGKGDPIVFLHGNPTSSYVWRNIIPYVKDLGHCIAPDLMGMGDSDKLPDSRSYTFAENLKYLEGLLEVLDIKQNIIFVVHDWGSVLAFDWARRHPQAVKGIVYMEALVQKVDWEEMPEVPKKLFQAMRSEKGEEMVLQQNSFIEVNLVKTILRTLSKEEMDEYRRPFLQPGEGRRAMLSWGRQLPIGGEPANIEKIVNDNGIFLTNSQIPKLFIESTPGAMSPKNKAFCHTWPNQKSVQVKGHHTPQEDSPDAIGAAIAVWIQGLQ